MIGFVYGATSCDDQIFQKPSHKRHRFRDQRLGLNSTIVILTRAQAQSPSNITILFNKTGD